MKVNQGDDVHRRLGHGCLRGLLDNTWKGNEIQTTYQRKSRKWEGESKKEKKERKWKKKESERIPRELSGEGIFE